MAGCSTARRIMSSTAIGRSGSRSSPKPAYSSSKRRRGRPAQPGLRSGAAHRRGLVRRRAGARQRPHARRCGEGATCGVDRDGDHHGRRLPAHSRPRPRARETTPAVRRRDRLVSGSPAQGRGHARRHRACPCTVVLRSADHRRRRSAQAAGGGDGQGVRRGSAQAVVFRHGLQLFGAMGFTWENDLQFALKRAKAGELLLGGAAEHRTTIAEEFDAADF